MTQGSSKKARKKFLPRIRWLRTRATAIPSTNLRATADTVKTAVLTMAALNCGQPRT
jgi:hypothetical protein